MSDADVARLLPAALDRFPDADILRVQAALKAELQAVERVAGGAIALESFSQTAGPLPTVLHVVRPIAEAPVTSPASTSIRSIVERRSLAGDAVLLDPADYRVLDKWRLVRTPDGPNPACTWGREVVLSYAAEVDQDARDLAVLDLLELDLNFSAHRRLSLPDASWDYGDQAARRREILGRVGEGARATVL